MQPIKPADLMGWCNALVMAQGKLDEARDACPFPHQVDGDHCAHCKALDAIASLIHDHLMIGNRFANAHNATATMLAAGFNLTKEER